MRGGACEALNPVLCGTVLPSELPGLSGCVLESGPCVGREGEGKVSEKCHCRRRSRSCPVPGRDGAGCSELQFQQQKDSSLTRNNTLAKSAVSELCLSSFAVNRS